MRLLLVIALLFALLPLWPTDVERVEISQRHYPSGQLKEEAEALVLPGQDIQYHGYFRLYSEGGALTTSGQYKNDKMEGQWRFWDENGGLVAEGFFTDNHGEVVNFNPDGSTLSRGPMDKLVRVGSWTEWYPSSRKRMQGDFVDGKMHGLWSYWTDEENPSRLDVTFDHGERLP